MPRTLSEHIIEMLDAPRSDSGPLSISHMARLLGVSSALVRSCAQQLVADGVAQPSMAMHGGVSVIQGLQRMPADADTSSAATS